MRPASSDTKRLNGVISADYELVHPGVVAKLDGDGIGVLE